MEDDEQPAPARIAVESAITEPNANALAITDFFKGAPLAVVFGGSSYYVSFVAEKRRLPVIASPSLEDDDDPRPPWHWVGFGTALIFGTWLPLAYATEVLKKKVIAAFIGPMSGDQIGPALLALSSGDRARLEAILMGLTVLGLASGAFAGGYLVGRWGGAGVGVREAALAGLMSGIIVSALALGAGGGLRWLPLAAGAFAASLLLMVFAGLGGWVGGKRRGRVA